MSDICGYFSFNNLTPSGNKSPPIRVNQMHNKSGRYGAMKSIKKKNEHIDKQNSPGVSDRNFFNTDTLLFVSSIMRLTSDMDAECVSSSSPSLFFDFPHPNWCW